MLFASLQREIYMLVEYIWFGYLLRYITAINANVELCIDGIEQKDDKISIA